MYTALSFSHFSHPFFSREQRGSETKVGQAVLFGSLLVTGCFLLFFYTLALLQLEDGWIAYFIGLAFFLL
jgi:hypothetical protein